MMADRRTASQVNSCRTAFAKVGFLGLALLACVAPWLPGLAQARVEKLSLAPANKAAAGQGACGAAIEAGQDRFEKQRASWASVTGVARVIPRFGRVAARAEAATLAAFEKVEAREADEAGCGPQRAALLGAVRKEIWTEFLAQRQLGEEATRDALSQRLLEAMRRRGAPLRTREKLEALRVAVEDYHARVDLLLPEWAIGLGDAEAEAAERRLGLVQFGIEESASGRVLARRWAHDQSKRLMGERAHGFSISLDPALRVMVRPEGLGNLQVFSEGPVGPPNQPATVNVGIMNDGSMADVYREHPQPPFLHVQPAAKVNLNVR